ncbi:ferredoxin--NADP reductase [Cupriavidus basilensis]|uniref:Flavodoxin reductases (Ferredoxin-NADPH reductases) family 1 n=1 Tax=Cupriavidus basilensis TaxID=68895 RepID=A0A0C4YF96_9BURK|nr:ferredoxin--NADP reductase [Cupriavidus basilensis]AJG19421.1 Flavodoxin reductases (ferredoxin-NADPH reductases) family 1 [Cupriavidus basilensis]
MQFHNLTVAQITWETEDARSYALLVPDALQQSFVYRAGQHLTFRVNVDGKTLLRSYSLSSSPEAGGLPVVTVKRIPGGRASGWFHAHVDAGTRLEVSAPTGRFVCEDMGAPLFFCAAGSGITPVLSMIRSALASTSSAMTLYYANRDAASTIFAAQIAKLSRDHSDRLAVHLHHDDTDGFPERGKIAALLSAVPHCQLYLCGPGPFMQTVLEAAEVAGMGPGCVHLERFDAAAQEPEVASAAPMPAQACDATVTLGGALHVVRVASGQSLLQAALACGVDAPYACEEGYCGSCAAKCVDGAVVHARNDVFSADELAAGWILTCQARPRQERPVAITFDV